MLRNKFFLILFLALCLGMLCLPHHVSAQPSFDYTNFSQIPFNHQGRVKPLGRVAQLTLKQMAHIDLNTDQAAAWMATLIFDPASADMPAIFFIPNPHIRHVLDLTDPASEQDAYYNFATLDRAFAHKADLILTLRETQENTLQKDQQELLALYAQVTFYEQLKNALTLLLPLKEPKQTRFIDLTTDQASKTTDIIAAKGKLNQSFRVIPFYGNTGSSDTWLAPWELWQHHKTVDATSNDVPALLQHWSDLADAYVNGDQDAWQKSARTLHDATMAESGDPLLGARLHAEIMYHSISLYFYSLWLYFFAFISSMALLKFPHRGLRIMTWGLFTSGLALHVIGIVTRIFILQRPPVTTLYESVLFVGAVITALGLWYIHRKKDNVLLPALGILAIALQLLGFALNDDGDSLQVLQAVLDTKFWLATHVIVITTGYALCLITGLMAHAALFVAARDPALPLGTHRFYKRSFYFSLLALLSISIGTLLGGIWADQSWGRFWGWDPKENGALLIVLWLVWLLHGRISRHFTEYGLVIGLAMLNMVVGISWIGVNLLGIGLHSYGFLNGSAVSLISLLIAEIVFFATCALLYFRRKSSHA